MDVSELNGAARGRPRDEALAARRRDEILEAAADVFASAGFHQTDVQAIADQLGIGKGTIYRYFPSKETLFREAVRLQMERLAEHIDTASGGGKDPFARMEQEVLAYLRFFDQHPKVLELLMMERASFRDGQESVYTAYRRAGQERWARILQSLMDQGRLRPMPLQRLMDLGGALVFGAVFANYLVGRGGSYEERAGALMDIILNGILHREESLKEPEKC